TLLLPHGYEGQGPEHSSARLERFLQLCADGNMQVVNATTPAQFFHVLRRQMHRSFRKPLIVMSPKSMLRHPRAVSRIAEPPDGAFQVVLDDPRAPDPGGVERVVMCAGKIFYALDAGREERDWTPSLAIVRLEQLYPFPEAELGAVLGRYARAAEFCWAQEEPANQGAWDFLKWRLERLLPGRRLFYAGRREAASPATGSHKIHETQGSQIVDA